MKGLQEIYPILIRNVTFLPVQPNQMSKTTASALAAPDLPPPHKLREQMVLPLVMLTSFFRESKSDWVLLNPMTSAPHLARAMQVALPIPAQWKDECKFGDGNVTYLFQLQSRVPASQQSRKPLHH